MTKARSTLKSNSIVLIGDNGVGKSTLLHRLSDKPAAIKQHMGYSSLIDTSNRAAICDLNRDLIKQADQIKNFLWKTKIVFLIFDLTNPDSLKTIEDLLTTQVRNNIIEFDELIDDNTYVLIGNKSDLTDKRQISSEQIKETAMKLGVDASLIFEISAEHSNQEDLNKIVNASINRDQQLHPEPITPKKPTLTDFLVKHKRKFLLALTAAAIAAIIITITALCWPLIVALPFVAAAGAAIATLNIGLTVSTATAALTGISISILGAGIISAGTWLASMFPLKNNKPLSIPASEVQNGPGCTSNIHATLGSKPDSEPSEKSSAQPANTASQQPERPLPSAQTEINDHKPSGCTIL